MSKRTALSVVVSEGGLLPEKRAPHGIEVSETKETGDAERRPEGSVSPSRLSASYDY